METWEYETFEIEPESLFDDLNLKGAEGWEFINLVVMNKIIQKMILGNPGPPQQITTFKLIYKRKKYSGEYPKFIK